MSIVVVDYGMGNLRSVSKAIEHIAPQAQVRVTADPGEILACDRVVVPGQGAMPDCMRQLGASGAHFDPEQVEIAYGDASDLPVAGAARRGGRDTPGVVRGTGWTLRGEDGAGHHGEPYSAPRREMLAAHHRQTLWVYWTIVMLGFWLLVAPFSFGYLNEELWVDPDWYGVQQTEEACPSAGGYPSAMMPEQEKWVSGSNRCM